MSTTPRQAPPLFSPEPAPRGRNLAALWLIALGAACALALALQIYHFWPFITDDAYVSLHYSQRLLTGHGLTWNDLQPATEGYTNLLWVLLSAGLGALGMTLATAAHLLGITTTVVAIVAVAAQIYRDYPSKVKFISALVACLSLCLSAPVAVWALGGLEQPLLSALLAWAAYFGIRWVSSSKGHRRDADVMGILLGLAVLSRADALLFTALFYAGAVLADGLRPRSMIGRARLLPLPILFFIAQEIFRYTYYGAWWPIAANGSGASGLHRLYTGLSYELHGAGSDIVFLLLALIGCVALWIAGKKRQVVFLATICIGWFFYILIIGGDVFPSYRFFVPGMALMGFLVAGCGLLTLAAPFRFSMARVTIFLGLTLLVLTSDLFAPAKSLEDQGKQIGLFLRTAFGDRHPLLVSDAAGAVPFYAEMSAIDPRQPRDGKNVLDQKPDILLLANDRGSAFFLADQQLLADPRFASHYQLIHIDAGPPTHNRAGLYIRRIDGRIGIESVGDIVTVPGYLAKIDDANSVRLIDGKAQLVIAPHGSAQFTAIPLVAGNWIATFEGAGAAQLGLRNAQRSRDCPGCVQSDQSGSATVTIENTSDQPAILTSLHLHRVANTGAIRPGRTTKRPPSE